MNNVVGGLFSIENLYLAYRKAKVDVFYERSQPMAERFCEYERFLHNNLSSLAGELQAKQPTWSKDTQFIGGFGYIPKGMRVPAAKPSGRAHFSLSDPEDAWKYILKQCKDERPTVEFRPVAHFTVNMYVVCALWVNLVGHKYDACLDECAHGSRLKRLRGESDAGGRARRYHELAPGSFQPYFYCYREWRERGLKAIRHELTEGRRVVALTMDLAGFYHNVDPRFLLEDAFLKESRFRDANGAELSDDERRFTADVVTAFETWAAQLPQKGSGRPPGVPVGPSAPRVIANVLLANFDRLLMKRLAPVYYGRYVDDIFLVLRDTGTFTTAARVIKHLSRRIKALELTDDGMEMRLNLPYAGRSQLLFKPEKQRVFVLSGEIGQDLLDAIESKIDQVSSEWRLLPNLEDLERSPAARVLTAARKSSEDADSLRKADELSLRRLGFSLMLRSVAALARDLPPAEWENERKRFYRFVSRHVLTPLRLLDLNDYLPRLLGLAVACGDWAEARRIVTRISRVVDGLRRNVAVEPAAGAAKQWGGYLRHLKLSLVEAVVCAWPLELAASVGAPADRVIDEINKLSPDVGDMLVDLGGTRARELFWSDLSRTPFKELLLDGVQAPATTRSFDASVLPSGTLAKVEAIERFVSSIGVEVPSLLPLLFPTRPLNAPEITECLPETSQNLALLRDYVLALRGTWVKPEAPGEEHGSKEDVVIGVVRPKDRADRGHELPD